MKIILFSSNINIIYEWENKYDIDSCIVCYDFKSLKEELEKSKEAIIICDYDTMAHDLNSFISSNTLPEYTIILEKAPEVATGKMLISHGVKAYGNSRMSAINFIDMLQAVLNDKTWTYPELTAALMKRKKQTSLNKDAIKLLQNRLTPKELDVVYLILNGLTNDAIASKLDISTRTVKAHITSIFSKLHINDRLSLVLLLK